MSAGLPVVDHDLSKLAPKFRAAVEQAIEDCHLHDGLDPYVYEAVRSAELQAFYYARGRTIIPPTTPVTNAKSHLYSWHAFGLAVDVISREAGWSKPYQWFANVASHFGEHGCKWGGTWKSVDLPHHQWGPCKPSPSDRAREILAKEGLESVWRAVGAD